jgi:hypothetical protein
VKKGQKSLVIDDRQAQTVSLNFYTYVENNPVMFVDPSGHSPIDRFLYSRGKLGRSGDPQMLGGGFGVRYGPTSAPYKFETHTNASSSTISGKGGRLGNQATREKNKEIADELESRGWTIIGGGGKVKEEYLPGPNGGRKGSNWVDITAQKNGKTLRVNTVDTRANGQITNREANAAHSIIQKTSGKGSKFIAIPK